MRRRRRRRRRRRKVVVVGGGRGGAAERSWTYEVVVHFVVNREWGAVVTVHHGQLQPHPTRVRCKHEFCVDKRKRRQHAQTPRHNSLYSECSLYHLPTIRMHIVHTPLELGKHPLLLSIERHVHTA